MKTRNPIVDVPGTRPPRSIAPAARETFARLLPLVGQACRGAGNPLRRSDLIGLGLLAELVEGASRTGDPELARLARVFGREFYLDLGLGGRRFR